MNVRRGGLGRGLGALIPTSTGAGPSPAPPASAVQGRLGPPTMDPSSHTAAADGGDRQPPHAVPGVVFREVPVDAIRPNPRQPRQVFDEDALDELVVSIREVGMLQPVVVRDAGDGGYELVMGERRWRAARLAELPLVPAIVRETADDAMLRDALLENLHRQQLNPLEEAAAYAQLLEEFGVTHEELATRIGRSRPQVTNTIRLLGLSPAVQRRVAAGVLSAGHARALLGIEDAGAQDRVAARIVAEGLSVRAVEEIVALGDTGAPAARPRRRQPTAPALTELSQRLSDHLETRVRVELGRQRGKVVVDFATLDDLDRILRIMAPQAVGPGDRAGVAPRGLPTEGTPRPTRDGPAENS